MQLPETMTLEQWLAKGEAELRAGPLPDRAHRDAETLLLHVIESERAALLVRWNERLDEAESAHYLDLIGRRHAGEPIQYILGETEFYGLPFHVTRDCLIPRPESEHLVEKAIELAASFKQPRIVDVGTGSGCIAVALAANLPHASLTATDLSAPALALARENAERNAVGARIRFLKGNLFAPVAEQKYEIIVSNPPYVCLTERGSLAAEVRDYEPPLALFAGADGLDVYRVLIPQAFAALLPGAWAALEIGYGQAEPVRALLAAAGFTAIDFCQDLQGIPRVVAARRL
ncbi:MAG: peptide chain release factor N(5)-glutamine methyltransferase [Terracidiphilus sp.]